MSFINLRNKLVKLLIIVILIVAFSCKKQWLEVKSNINQSIPKTLPDFQALLDNTGKMNSNVYSLGEIAADGHYISENVWIGSVVDAARNAYTWSHNFPYNKQEAWSSTYNKIFTCNLILKGLTEI